MSLRVLKLGTTFSHRIPYLPSNLKVLVVANIVRRDWSELHLPSGLEELLIGSGEVTGLLLPLSLKKLTFGLFFVSSVRELRLPPHLRMLEFPDCFNHSSVKELKLLSELVELRFGTDFKQSLYGLSLPPSLRCLKFTNPTYNVDEVVDMRARGLAPKQLMILGPVSQRMVSR